MSRFTVVLGLLAAARAGGLCAALGDEACRHSDCDHAALCQSDPGAPLSACFAPGTDPEYAAAASQILYGAGPQGYTTYARWTSTSTDGATGGNGGPITLTYSFVPDYSTGDPTTSNTIHATMDAKFGSRATWKALFNDMFSDWADRTGIRFIEVADDGAAWPNSPGVVNVRGDVRIVAFQMDGTYGVLAYNYYPSLGDMALDNAEPWEDTTDNYRFTRNVLLHELGHGIGLQHVAPVDGTKLMEPYLGLGFDGPQDDDIRGANYYYGDPDEPNATAGAAASVGSIASPVTLENRSLHSNSDADWYYVGLSAGASLQVSATPVGAAYSVGPDGGTPTSIDTRTVNPLKIELYNEAGTVLLGDATASAAGQPVNTATYAVQSGDSSMLVKVSTAGSAADVQRYQLVLTPAQVTTHGLVISSTGTTGVTISLSPSAVGDVSSLITPNAVLYVSGVAATLTAPQTSGNYTFRRWQLDGVDRASGDRELDVTMSAAHTAVAVYNPSISVEAGANVALVAGESATLNAAATGGTPPFAYSWTPAATLSSPNSASTTATPSATTTYTVTVTDSVGLSASDTTTVEVYAALAALAGDDQLVAPGQVFTLSGAATGGVPPYQYQWSPEMAGASPSNQASLQASVAVTTTFTLAVTDAGGRTASDTLVVSVPAPVTVSAGSDQVILSGGSAQLSASASGGSPPYDFSWSPTGVELSSSGQVIRVTPTENTDFVVTVTDAAGQQASDTVRVSLATPLSVTAVADPATIPLGQSARLSAAAAGGAPPYAYTWSPAGTLSGSQGVEVFATPTTTSSYTLIATDALGQSATTTVQVTVDTTVVAGDTDEAPLAPFAPVVPSPCGFGFASVFPFMLIGTIRWRRR